MKKELLEINEAKNTRPVQEIRVLSKNVQREFKKVGREKSDLAQIKQRNIMETPKLAQNEASINCSLNDESANLNWNGQRVVVRDPSSLPTLKGKRKKKQKRHEEVARSVNSQHSSSPSSSQKTRLHQNPVPPRHTISPDQKTEQRLGTFQSICLSPVDSPRGGSLAFCG